MQSSSQLPVQLSQPTNSKNLKKRRRHGSQTKSSKKPRPLSETEQRLITTESKDEKKISRALQDATIQEMYNQEAFIPFDFAKKDSVDLRYGLLYFNSYDVESKEPPYLRKS